MNDTTTNLRAGMRTIEIIVTDDRTSRETRIEYGTNDRDGGLFVRTPSGAWHQVAGNSQTPRFRNVSHMMRHLRNRHYDDVAISMIRGSAQGW